MSERPTEPSPHPQGPAPVAPHRRKLLLRVWALATMGFAIRALAEGWLGPVERERGLPWSTAVVDVNRASVPDLSALPGLGPVRARAIVLHRVRHGWFASLDDLAGIDGIGADTIEALRPFATVGGAGVR